MNNSNEDLRLQNTDADLVTGPGTGGHNIVTGDEAQTDAGATGLATGAIIGGAIGTLVGGPVGTMVGGTIGSILGGVAGDATEVGNNEHPNSTPLADLTTGINADRDPSVGENAVNIQTPSQFLEAPLSGNATLTDQQVPPASQIKRSDDVQIV